MSKVSGLSRMMSTGSNNSITPRAGPVSQRSFAEIASCEAYSAALPTIAQMLVQECGRTQVAEQSAPWMTVFENAQLQGMHPKDFLIRMCKYQNCSRGVYVLMAVYLDRFRSVTGIHVTQRNVNMLMLVASVCAIKYIDDQLFSNTHYAGIGGITVQEFNLVERTFLQQLDCDCTVDVATFETYHYQLQQPPRARAESLATSQGLTSTMASRTPLTAVSSLRGGVCPAPPIEGSARRAPLRMGLDRQASLQSVDSPHGSVGRVSRGSGIAAVRTRAAEGDFHPRPPSVPRGDS